MPAYWPEALSVLALLIFAPFGYVFNVDLAL